MKAKIELVGMEQVEKFVQIAKSIDCDVRLTGEDENGCPWDISAKSLLCSLVMSQREQHRKNTAHTVNWATIWCECEQDIYSKIQDFVVIDESQIT